jgi:SPW repeat-containing protein
MKTISTSMHGILDLSLVLALIFLPNFFGFSEVGGAPVCVPRILAILALSQSLATQYELGLLKVLPMRVHLMSDYVFSLFLAASPWLFGFENQPGNVWVVYLIVGLALFGVTLITKDRATARAHVG